MGQGFSVTTPSAGAAGIEVPELADLVYEKTLGSARFMKTIRARHHDGVVLVKVFIKPYTPMSLSRFRKEIIRKPPSYSAAYQKNQWLKNQTYTQVSASFSPTSQMPSDTKESSRPRPTAILSVSTSTTLYTIA